MASKAIELLRRRIIYSEDAFAELVLWELATPLAASFHPYKYRLAFVLRGECVLRFDNEAGKGDHKHVRGREIPFAFTGVEALLAAFQRDIERILREDSRT